MIIISILFAIYRSKVAVFFAVTRFSPVSCKSAAFPAAAGAAID
jgi:hypothetical protein